MNLNTRIFFLILLCCNVNFAQQDNTVILEVVVLNDVKLKQFSAGQKVKFIADSIAKQEQSFTDLLNFNSLIYFKENGYGMVSSPSFRGTTASQTAVIWNGININSSLTGQTDFNLLATNNFTSIAVKSGGGGVQYGSGAVGGSIHLGNDFNFKKESKHRVHTSLGSFSTINANYSGAVSNENASFQYGFQYKSSENDYEYLGTSQQNENGSYEFAGLHFNSGFFLNENTALKVFHNSEFSDRNLSGTTTFEAKDAYKDENSKTLVQLDLLNSKITSNFRLAHLYELYQYFPDHEKTHFYTTGKTNTFIGKYDANLKLKPQNILLKGILEYKRIVGNGTNISDHTQNSLSVVLLLNQKIKEKFEYGVNLRTEFNDQFSVPLIFSVDGKWNFNKTSALKFSTSKNYRTPTFNDLYWVPGGNLDLKPEHSNQVEIGLDHGTNGHDFNLTTYYIRSRNLIKWVPQSSTIWSPINIASSENYGLEFNYDGLFKIGGHQWNTQFNYGYTHAKDLDSEQFLIYVPKHKTTASVAYLLDKWQFKYQFMFNGAVYTTTDNSQNLDAYDVSNIKVAYQWDWTDKVTSNLQFEVNNIFNEIYENVAFRPMPNRNYNLKLIINI